MSHAQSRQGKTEKTKWRKKKEQVVADLKAREVRKSGN